MSKQIEEKVPVAIYIKYDDELGEDWVRKEKFLNQYCEERGYKVIETFRDIEPKCEYFSGKILDILCKKEYNYRKLIAIDTEELSKYDSHIFGLFLILLDKDTRIETVKDGILGEDLIFGLSINRNVMQKEELEKAQSISFQDSPFWFKKKVIGLIIN